VVKASTLDSQNSLEYDEVAAFLNMRYIGACEAAWRIFSFKLYDMSHSVLLLGVHLPGENVIRFDEGLARDAMAASKNRFTTLTAWFEVNKHDEFARSLHYHEMTNHYRFDFAKTAWIRRNYKQKNPQIARMAMVSPKNRERYALRLLLFHPCNNTRTYLGSRTEFSL
jgi:hypothetical protein